MDRVGRIAAGLALQGWPQAEIAKASSVLQEAPAKRSPWLELLDNVIYWVLLAVAILANFIVSIVLVPFLLVLTGPLLYGALAFLGLVFGTMLDVVVRETEFLQKKHYVVAEVLVPAIALINIYMITRLSNKLALIMALPGDGNSPLLVALVYVVAFALPHFIYGRMHARKHTTATAA